MTPTPTPVPTPTPTPVPPPADVAATLAWMLERTLTCTETDVAPASRTWTCTGSTPWPDGSVDTVTITIERNDRGATHLTAVLDARESAGKDMCPGLVCDGYTGFFSDTIALAPITGNSGPAISQWIDSNPHAGRHGEFGQITVDYQPLLPIMTMTVDIAAGS
ncbi:MAG TPA: hypothetical protein VFI15_04630 [Candidatus Limnocylindrales bacterium]|nr:hypothetical protein [Candidatus Limnocylindrales bacterium]